MTPIEFLHWWRDGLLAATPRGLRRLLAPAAPVIEVSALEQGCRFHRRGTDAVYEERLFPASERPSEGLRAWLKEHAPPGTRVHVRAAPEDVLATEIGLPAAAIENLAEVVGFEMDRFTPFSPEAVYYGFRIIGVAEETVRVRLSVLPRQHYRALVEALEGAGLPVQCVIPSESDLPPVTEGLTTMQVASGGQRTRLALTLTALGLAGLVLYLPFHRTEQQIEAADARVFELRREAMALRKLEDRLNESLKGAQAVSDLKANSVLTIDLLAAVTEALPESAWTYRLNRRGDEVVLQGEADEANTLLGAIERVPLLEDASFNSTVQRNNATGRDRYQISATIVANRP